MVHLEIYIIRDGKPFSFGMAVGRNSQNKVAFRRRTPFDIELVVSDAFKQRAYPMFHEGCFRGADWTIASVLLGSFGWFTLCHVGTPRRWCKIDLPHVAANVERYDSPPPITRKAPHHPPPQRYSGRLAQELPGKYLQNPSRISLHIFPICPPLVVAGNIFRPS